MSIKLLNDLMAMLTCVVDTSDTDYNYTGLSKEFGSDTTEAKWLIIKERKTNTNNTLGTIVYSSNPFNENKELVFNNKFSDRKTIQYNNNVNLEN